MFGMPKWKVWLSALVCAWGLLYAAPNLLPAQQAAQIPDYLPHEHRLIKRCQVMATRYFRNGEP